MGRFARVVEDDGGARVCLKAEGRKSSRRKERGRGASPFPFTSAGNADRIRVFWHFGFKIPKGLQFKNVRKKGVVDKELLRNIERIAGLR